MSLTVLQKNEHRVAQLVGLEEKFLMDRYRNGALRQKPGAVISDRLLEQERIAKRFFAALILHDLLQEVAVFAATYHQLLHARTRSLRAFQLSHSDCKLEGSVGSRQWPWGRQFPSSLLMPGAAAVAAATHEHMHNGIDLT